MTKKKQVTTITRKKQITPKNLSSGEKFEVIDAYAKGEAVTALAERYNMKRVTMEKFIHNYYKTLAMTSETNALVAAQRTEKYYQDRGFPQKIRVSYNNPALINEKFLELLSDYDTDVLTEGEQLYCVVYAQTGNNCKAMRAAGLDAGIKTKERIKNVVDHNLMLRGIYLRHKPLIKETIKSLQNQTLKDLQISKDYIQTNLIQTIEELREEVGDDPRVRTHLLRSIELLGKTIGAFQEHIVIEELDPSKALSTMVEMAKNEVGGYEPA